MSTAPQARIGQGELARLERELEAEWQRLQQDGHGYAGVRAGLEEPKRGDAEGRRALAAADEAQEAFLARLDAFLRRLHSHFIDQVCGELEHAMRTMRGFYGEARIRHILRDHRRLERLAREYRALEGSYGTPRDHRRIDVYQRFYAGVVAFSRRIRALDPTMPAGEDPSLVEWLYRARRVLVWGVRRSGALLRAVAAFLGAVWTACVGSRSQRGTPFTRRVDQLFRAWGQVRGYRVEVSGAEHLGAEPGGGITLYAPAHRHGVTDNVTTAHLELPDYLVFSAVDQLPLLPGFLIERVARTPGLIAVGGGRGPSVDRALEALDRGVSRNLLVYPEGSVSEGFRGTRPPRREFGEGLVRRLREAGHRLRIVPIAYLDNARFLDLPPVSNRPEDRRLRVRIPPALEDGMIGALLEAGGGDMLGRMLRLAWLESLITDEELLFGQDRMAAIERRLDRELDGIRYWGSLESAPVSDRLSTASGEPVRVREEPFGAMRVRVFQLPSGTADEKLRITLPQLQDPDSSELLIGIRPPSHIYLNVGRRRFDGDIFRPLKVKERDTVFPGIVIRFMGVPVKSLHAIGRKLEEYAGREQRTLTCANSACRVIARAANLEIADHADLRPFLPSHVLPTRTIRKLIERGVRNHAGEPVEVQIYKTDDRSLEAILAECRREEIRIARDHLEAISIGALRRIGAAARGLLGRLKGSGGPPPPSG